MLRQSKILGYARSAYGNRRFRAVLAVFVLVITLVLFVSYASANPQIFRELASFNPLSGLAILLLYGLFLLSNAAILLISVALGGKQITNARSLALSAYSTLVNFFGPLQSGPGFRAIYLKHVVGLKIKDYVAASLIHYLMFALISGVLLLIGTTALWAALGVVVAASGLAFVVWRRSIKRFTLSAGRRVLLIWLVLATAAQIATTATIYFVELKALDPSISLLQALSYTGAANFALFVSLTPGAIGIREAFLLFSSSLHGIDQQVVLAASVIDRGIFFVFLGILFVLSVAFGIKKRFGTKS